MSEIEEQVSEVLAAKDDQELDLSWVRTGRSAASFRMGLMEAGLEDETVREMTISWINAYMYALWAGCRNDHRSGA